MFDLKSPCATCPFRKGKGSHFRLHQRKRNVRIMLALASGERRRAVAEREGITRPRITQIVQEANKQGVMRRRKWVPLPVENGENVA
jgi:hypothetical protein